MERLSVRKVIDNLDRKHIAGILLWVVLTGAAISFIGQMLYRATQEELRLRGELDVIQSADRFNTYLIADRNALILAENGVNKLLVAGAPTENILNYITEETENLTGSLAKSFTGLYGWIRGEYLDGAGWVPGEDFVPTERPWYKAAAAHPQEIVFVDPYVDLHTDDVMMTIAKMLDDGESVIALDIGLEGVQQITDELAADTPGAMVMVLDNSNTAIAHSIGKEVGRRYSEEGNTLGSLIVRQMNANQEGSFTVAYNGQSYMVFTKQIEGGWHSVSAIDTELFYSPLRSVILLTLALGLIALALVIGSFYSLSLREISNRNLGIQIRAAADIYENLLDISLPDNTYCELNNRKDPSTIGRQSANAQEMLRQRTERWVEESMKPYMLEFLDFSTLDQRLSGRDSLTSEFLDVENVWYRGRIICAERRGDGKVTRILWGTESIDDEKRQQEHLRHLAETDLMTGVNNRISGEYGVSELLSRGKGGMFVLFDVDHFKSFNDRYGHQVGDQVIIAVANCLKNAFRGDDIVMRLGGDEFAAFAPGVYTEEVGARILERFYDYVNNITLEESVREKVCVSAGAVFARAEAVSGFAQLYEDADRCMYESKGIEGNHITYAA